jgi:hypothetical protein
MKPESATLHYAQDGDSCGPTNEICQELTVEVCDAGGGNYVVLSTARWAINPDGIDAFADALRAALSLCEREAA